MDFPISENTNEHLDWLWILTNQCSADTFQNYKHMISPSKCIDNKYQRNAPLLPPIDFVFAGNLGGLLL